MQKSVKFWGWYVGCVFCCWFCFVFEPESNYEAIAGLRLTVYTRLTLTSQRPNNFCLLSAMTTDVCHHVWLVPVEF